MHGRFRRTAALLEIVTASAGIVAIILIARSPDVLGWSGYWSVILGLFPLLYLTSGILLWRGSNCGYWSSFFLTFIAVIDVDMDDFEWAFSNGLFLNLDLGPILIDVWSLMILFVVMLSVVTLPSESQ